MKTEVYTIKAAKSTEKKTPEELALKAAEDKALELERELAVLKAGQKPNDEPPRKTIAASQLLSKYGGGSGTNEPTDIASFCAAVDQLNLSSTDSIQLKLKAKAEFGAKERD